MDRPEEQPSPLPLAELGIDADAADSRARADRAGRRRFLTVAGLGALATAMALAFWGTKPTDDLSEERRRQLRAAMVNAAIGPTRVNLVDPEQMKLARASFGLPQAAADQIIDDARAGRIQLAWVSVRDFLDEDGDVAQISIGGFQRTVPLKTAPTLVAVPIVPGEFLRVTGLIDGAGGGVTVGVSAGGAAEIQMPLDVGETIAIAVR